MEKTKFSVGDEVYFKPGDDMGALTNKKWTVVDNTGEKITVAIGDETKEVSPFVLLSAGEQEKLRQKAAGALKKMLC